MNPRGALALALVLLAACSRTRDESAGLGAVRSHVPVRLERTTTAGPNLGGAPEGGAVATLEARALVIELDPPLRLPAPCADRPVDVAVAPDGSRAAFRCAVGEPWSFVFPAPEPPHHVVIARAAPGAADGFPDWKTAPDIESAVAGMLAQGEPPHTVLAALRAQRGLPGLARLLPHVVGMPLRLETAERGDAWLEAYASLPEADRAPSLANVRGALEVPHTGAGALRRAVELVPIDPENVHLFALRLAEVDEAQRKAAPPGDVLPAPWQREALLRVAEIRHSLAVPIACGRLARNRYDADARRIAADDPCAAAVPPR